MDSSTVDYPRKRKVSDGNINPSPSASNDAGPSHCCPCIHCHCGCHNDAAYLDSLPIGYRFEPTDEELVIDYLIKKIKNEPLPKNKICEANIYGDHPKDIVRNYPQAIEGGWYFFTSRDRKYPGGKRPTRKAGPGYWKASGPDKVIKNNGIKISARKSLVYHEGCPPKGPRTNWMMHEYVLEGYERQRLNDADMKLDDYILCKIYTKVERGEETIEQDQQPGVASNENLSTNQHASSLSNQDANHLISGVENTTRNLNSSTQHVHNNLVNSCNQQVNDQQARGLSFQHSNQNASPVIRGAENSYPVVDSNHNRDKEVNKDVMVHDQRVNPPILQVKNNVIISPCTPYMMSARPFQMTSFQRIRPPLPDHSSLTRFNYNCLLQNPPYLPLTPRQSPPLPPRIAYSPHGPMHPEMWSGPSCNPPPPVPRPQVTPRALQGPRPQVTPRALQEGNERDGINLFNQNIELMYAQDGDGVLDNSLLEFDGHEHLDVDESVMNEESKSR